MKKQLFLILILLLSLNALGQKIDKFSYPLYEGKYSNKDFFNKAEYIFEGEVLYTKNYLNEDTTRVLASSVVKVIHVFKGNLEADTIEFVRYGGQYRVNYPDNTFLILEENYHGSGFSLARRMIFFAKKREGRTFNNKFKVKLTPLDNVAHASLNYSIWSDHNFILYGLRDLYFKSMEEFYKYAKKQMRRKKEFILPPKKEKKQNPEDTVKFENPELDAFMERQFELLEIAKQNKKRREKRREKEKKKELPINGQ